MMTEQTISKLKDMRLEGMAEAYERQRNDPNASALSFDERFSMLVEREWVYQQDRALQRRLKNARLKQNACLEDLKCDAQRGLKRDLVAQLSDTLGWIGSAQHCIITGATGVGKSFLACALGQKACRDGYKALYTYAPRLFRELYSAQVDGSLGKFLRRMSRFHLLIVDDWGLEQGKRSQYRHFLELLEERQGHGSMLITSQFPPDTWHDTIGDATVADGILDRLIHGAYRIDLKGESMRSKNNTTKSESG